MQTPVVEVTRSETVYMGVGFPDGGIRYFRPDRGETITGRAC